MTNADCFIRGISIHALREEGDLTYLSQFCLFLLFLSTPSARRATDLASNDIQVFAISIHALREEGDALFLCP